MINKIEYKKLIVVITGLLLGLVITSPLDALKAKSLNDTLGTAHNQSQFKIIHFCCCSRNIGDRLPVLGIQQMLGMQTDCISIKSRDLNNIDFDFINKNYKCAIVGAAGLFHAVFEPFWKLLYEKCTIPMIIWGVGACVLKKSCKQGESHGVDKKIIQNVVSKCDLVNVRDKFTANYYDLKNAHISACPSMVYLQKFKKCTKKANISQSVLFSLHSRYVSMQNAQSIKKSIRKTFTSFSITNHRIQRMIPSNIDKLIIEAYGNTDLVVTTRLHGAIIAYALGIPYVAISYDKKIDAFCKEYGNGICVKNLSRLRELLQSLKFDMQPVNLDPIIEFGNQARQWVIQQCKE